MKPYTGVENGRKLQAPVENNPATRGPAAPGGQGGRALRARIHLQSGVHQRSGAFKGGGC